MDPVDGLHYHLHILSLIQQECRKFDLIRQTLQFAGHSLATRLAHGKAFKLFYSGSAAGISSSPLFLSASSADRGPDQTKSRVIISTLSTKSFLDWNPPPTLLSRLPASYRVKSKKEQNHSSTEVCRTELSPHYIFL